MATTVFRFLHFVYIILILLSTLYGSSHGIVGHLSNRRTISTGGGSIRSLLGANRNSQMVDCSEMASKSQCLHKSSKCLWCRSQALDDMCFSKSESWRLPPEVFSCD